MNQSRYHKLKNHFLYKKFRHTFLRDLGHLIDTPVTEGLVLLSGIKKRLKTPKHHILIAAMPKSGSTFLTKVLVELTGYREYRLNFECNQNEQDFYLPRLISAYGFDTITHQHLRATTPNLHLLKTFSIQPIILVRNIFDVVISIRDHLHGESLEVPFIFLNEQFYELDEVTKLDLIIEMGLSWYFYFYVSWYDACRRSAVNAIWITYEELMSNKIETLMRVLNFLKLSRTKNHIEEAIQKTVTSAETRLNKGIAGRGKAILSERQVQKIIDKASFYPWVDFSKIGIDHPQSISPASHSQLNENRSDVPTL